jgi:hypothetical protein
MGRQNIYVVLACVHSTIKDYVNVQFFEYEDAIPPKNDYISPHSDIEFEENEVFPEKSQWRFATLGSDWHPFGYFVAISSTEAVSVVSKLSHWEASTERPVSSFLKGHEGAQKWKDRDKIRLQSRSPAVSLHR